MSTRQIAAQLGLVKSTVAYHIRRFGIPADERFARRYDWSEIRAAYDGGLSARECRRRFGCSRHAWNEAAKRGDIVLRDWVMPIADLLVVGRKTNRSHLKIRLLKEGLKENRCERCGLTEWKGEPLSMALHHVNGDGTDNRLENIALLCPNCHAQTPNYGGKNGHKRKPLPRNRVPAP